VPHTSPDNEERRLLAEYETATRHYSWAVGELVRQRASGILDRDNYIKLSQLAEDAFAECEKARTALKNSGLLLEADNGNDL
jgi:hypothetical protein